MSDGSTKYRMRKREEVEMLKRQWLEDPIWDLELTDGFEEYRDELLHYRLDIEEKYRKREEGRIRNLALELGCTEEMALWLDVMNQRINTLEDRVNRDPYGY